MMKRHFERFVHLHKHALEILGGAAAIDLAILGLWILFVAGAGAAVAGVTVEKTRTTTTSTTTTTVPTATGATPGIGALAYGGNLKYVTNLNKYSMVIGSSYSSDSTLLASSAGRSLTYFDGTDIRSSYSTGVTYTDAVAHGWLLKSATGALLFNSQYSSYCADIGSTGYQAKWISNVTAYLVAHPGTDGIFIDNVLPNPKADCGAYPAKYPTTVSYSAAQVSFVKTVYTSLSAKGYYVALNGGAYTSGDPLYNDGTATLNWWKRIGPYSSGLMNENYDQTSHGLRNSATAWYGYFDSWQRLIGTAQGMGKDFIGLTKSSGMNTTTALYGKASFLLEWDGRGSVFMYICGGSCNPTNSVWTQNIGIPKSAKVAVGVGYKRSYTAGTVLVNPSPSTSQKFTVNTVAYTLAPTTARILKP